MIVRLPATPSVVSPKDCWARIIAFLVDAPATPSIAPGSNPFFSSNDCTYFTLEDGALWAVAVKIELKPMRMVVLARMTFKLSLADLAVNFFNQAKKVDSNIESVGISLSVAIACSEYVNSS